MSAPVLERDVAADVPPADPDAPAAEPPTGPSRGARLLWPQLVVGVTLGYATVVHLLTPGFFQRGDTAAQFAPTWWHLGELVRDGAWPPAMDPDSWQGGNYAAEALYGVYNPLNVLVWLAVSLSGDLVLATFVVKAVVLAVLALGTYLLAREYGAAPWAAAVVAIALPFSGFTLYWDAGSWPSGLMAFAYTPWVWWVFRRVLRGASNPLWAFVIGVLAVTQGNPYGTLALVAVGFALVVEGVVLRRWGGVLRLVVVGACVAAFLPLVYLPLLESSDLAVRSGGALFENSGKLRPQIGDLFGLSSPTYVPGIRAITGPMKVPATYFTWLLLPILPWLRWGVLRGRGRELTALGLLTVGYLLLAVGPSKLWLFRWPLRVLEYAWLGLAVLLAVLLTAGLARTHVRWRLVGTAALVAFTGLHAWSQHPSALRQVAVGVAITGAGAAVVLLWHLVRPSATAVLALLCIAVTGVTVVAQNRTFGENASSRGWYLPRDVDALQERFADRQGLTMQFADLKPLQNRGRIGELKAAWRHYLPGSMYHVAGVEAVNNYTGMGYRPFGRRFCMEYDGLTQKCGYRNLWDPVTTGQPPLVDLMKVETVVVQPKLAKGVVRPDDWLQATKNDDVIVLERAGEVPWPQARLSWADEEVSVTEAATTDRWSERVEVADTGAGGELVFATLAWPGWEATFDGRPVEVDANRVGLLTVDLPPGASGELALDFTPPGRRIGLLAGLAGTVGALVLGAVVLVMGRRRRAGVVDDRDHRDDRGGDQGGEAWLDRGRDEAGDDPADGSGGRPDPTV
ncbi:hypothetical protein [Nocardioides sp. SYSU D00038]|uniref:hypothetical protein n=1 Tax=Nocardioides sp. SYSU D00038 TaxID=2812554 RepID=UPI0019680012|nr:hypothetical protein [Nocardioides sp. SYSU D00038]